MGRMTRSQKFLLGFLSVFACLTWLLFGLLTSGEFKAWTVQPLGPTMAFPTDVQLHAAWTASPAPVEPTAAIGPAPASPFLACDSAPGMTILAIGTDVRPGEHRSGLTDVMRAVRVDFVHQRVTMLEFPRDLWVQIPGVDFKQKLNTAYAYGNPDHGPSLLAQTLNQNFGLKVDHYIVANMTVFAEVVDALGGLDIVIPPGGIDGRTSTDRSERLVFPEGLQHLTGEQALTLARIRNTGVFRRAKNQNLVVCALRERIESPDVILRLPVIINSFIEKIQTDLTPEQISQLACLGTQMPRANILFAAFPHELFRSAEVYDARLKLNVSIWEADFRTLSHYVADFQEGTWSSTGSYGTSEPEASSCD